MFPSPTSFLPARARRVGRIALPGLLVAGLAAGTLTAVTATSESASAAGGSFTIGADPVQLVQATDPEIGKLTPSADAATNGMFGTQAAWPLIPLHATVARNGNIVSYGTPLDQAVQGGLEYDVWDPSTSFDRAAHVDSASMHDYDSFCNSIVELDDGRLLMAGGNSSMGTMIFDPVNSTQTMGTNLDQPRWYGTTLRVPDGRILVLGGGATYYGNAYLNPDNDGNLATTPEIGTGTGAWTQLNGATSSLFGAKDNRYWYPRAFNGPNGTVVGTSGGTVWTLSTTGNGTIQQTGTLPFNPKASGSQVMYAPGKILVAGGGQPEPAVDSVGLNDAAIIDVSGTTPVVQSTSSMQWGRNWLNLTVLPNGEVFANGGTKVGIDVGDANSVRTAEIWNPASGTWRTAATAQRTRTYHSTSLLMPSGAVFTGGGGAPGPEDNLNAELYYPSYLFTKGADGVTRWASRPAITSIAGSATYGGQITLATGDDRKIASASLISLPSVTHSQNTDQRRIPLAVTQNGASVSAVLPASVDTMPPGDYELTVVDGQGVPSTAQILTIRRGAAGLVTTASQANTGANGGTAVGTPNSGGHTGTTAPVAGAHSGSTIAPLTVDSSIGLEVASKLGTRVAHTAGSSLTVRSTGSIRSTTDKKRTSWVVRPGLASTRGISFESLDRPGYYLVSPKKGAGTVTLAKFAPTKQFAARATFIKVGGNTGTNMSFTTWSQHSLYLRVDGGRMSVGLFNGSKSGRSGSTFLVRVGSAATTKVPLTAGRSVGIEFVGKSGYRLRQIATETTVTKVGRSPSSTIVKATSWTVRTVKGGIMLESVSKKGYFLGLSARSSKATLLKKSSSASFAKRTVFVAVKGLTEGNTSFRLKSTRNHYLQLSRSRLTIASVARTHAVDATFAVRSGLAPAPTR